MNDPRSVFERAAKKNKQATQDPATKEMPLSQRLDRMRGKKPTDELQPDSRWRPSRPEDRLTERTSTFSDQPKVARTVGGVLETDDLRQAREAERARRKALETKTTEMVQRQEIIPENATALTVGWLTRNVLEVGGKFFNDPEGWNVTQLCKCLDYQIRSGQPGFTLWGISQMDACFEFLLAGGYLVSEHHHRGQSAPKDFSQFIEPQPAAPEPVRSGNRPVFFKNNEAAEADAKKLSFDDLQKQARSQFKPDNRLGE